MSLQANYLKAIQTLEAKRDFLSKRKDLVSETRFIAISRFIDTVREEEKRGMSLIVLKEAVEAVDALLEGKITQTEFNKTADEIARVQRLESGNSTLAVAMYATSWAIFIGAILTLPLLPALVATVASIVLADISRQYETHRVKNPIPGKMDSVSLYCYKNTLFAEPTPVEEKPEQKEEQQSSWWPSFGMSWSDVE